MNKIATFMVLALSITACTETSKEKMDYPETRKGEVVDNYFGTDVPDPYRWLEDDMSEETADWVTRQNDVTFGYLNKIPYREKIREQLTEMINFERISAPTRHGDYLYYSKNDGLQDQSLMYRQKKGEEPEVFLDPNTFSEDGTTSLAGISFTKDGSLAAYQISEGGSDWRKVIVMETESKKLLGDTLKDIKFSGTAWRGNKGFYYSSYDKPKGSELSAMTDQHKLYFHKLGTSQEEDELLFGEKDKRRYVSAYLTEDEHFLIISTAISTTGNELYIKDLSKQGSPLVKVVDNFDNEQQVLDNKESLLYIITNLNAPNQKIVTVDAANPGPDNWTDFIPETENVLQPGTGGGYIFANYMVDAVSKVLQYDMEGGLIREVSLPGVGTAGGFGGKKEEKELYFTFSNYTTPGTIYKYDPASGESKEYIKPDVKFDGSEYESKQIFYESKDGTKVPMIITFKKGTEMNGSNPTLLYGYGGFNISLQPSFSITRALWMEMGGILAVANLRGGGEYGEKWHLAGTKMNKQNVFDDFIAAGEYLIENSYTSSDYLAIQGGSNGGLLVGAVMCQRPDLIKVALPAVGVMDMLRYHTFTAGAGWAYDYGTSEDSKEMFEYMYGYSPVHNVKAGTEYPATLVTTGDHDDRVVPAHSFKFAAELQDKQSGLEPVLIRIETKAGHGAGTPISKTIEQYADIYGFTLYSMGIKEVL